MRYKLYILIICTIIGSITTGCSGNPQPKIKPTAENSDIKPIQNTSAESITLQKATQAMFIILNINSTVFSEDELGSILSEEITADVLEGYSISKSEGNGEHCDLPPISPSLRNFKVTGDHTCTIDYYETEIFGYTYTLVFNEDNTKVIKYSFVNIKTR